MRGLPQKQNARRADKIRLCGHLRRYKKIVKKTYIIYIKYYISNCKVRGIKGFVIDGLNFSFCFRNALNSKERVKVLFFGILPGVYCKYVR